MKDIRDIEMTVDRYLTQIAIELGMDLVDITYRLSPHLSGGERLTVTCAFIPNEEQS